MKRVPRILLVLPLIVMAAYVVGFRGTTGEALLSTPQNDGLVIGCVHRWDSSFDCPQFNPQEIRAVRTDRVEKIEITLFIKDGEPLTWTHGMSMAPEDTARNVDAVFFREPSVENFYISYLEKIEAPEARIEEVREMVRALLPQPHQ